MGKLFEYCYTIKLGEKCRVEAFAKCVRELRKRGSFGHEQRMTCYMNKEDWEQVCHHNSNVILVTATRSKYWYDNIIVDLVIMDDFDYYAVITTPKGRLYKDFFTNEKCIEQPWFIGIIERDTKESDDSAS